MVKEVLTKKDIVKKTALTKDEIQLALIDNFINLQKVMANLSVKFDELSLNISRLLQLFEISAKTFAEKYSAQEPAPSNLIDAAYIKKLDTLLDQNKVISKGIMLIEEKLRDKTTQQEEQANYPTQQPYSYQQMQPMQMLPSMQQPTQQQQSQSPYKKEIGARQDPKPLPRY